MTASEHSLTAKKLETLAGVRLLLVDDDRNTLDMLTEVLRLYGAEVRAAHSASEARAILRRWLPMVMVSDVGMPEEDGYQLIRAIRALPPGSGGDVPAIALTGFARSEDRSLALSAGYHEFILKPVDIAMLVSAIQAVIPHTTVATPVSAKTR